MGQMPAHDDGAARRFSAKLMPHRSLGPRGFVILMSLVCAVSFIAGFAFFLAGAWPVICFFGLDVALIYWAFKANYASARLYETVDITADELVVRRFEPRRPARTWTFQPYWVRVELSETEDTCGPLYLKSHGRRLQIGAFLSADERKDFAEALRAALARPAF
ncbi:MAG: DUF2244 domain-containing protein [Hyphomicrobiales bacterium]